MSQIFCKRCGKPIIGKGSRDKKYCSKECRTIPIGTKKVLANGGYIEIKTYNGWLQEHRYIMEQHLCRSLLPNERVHHKNGDRTDNRLENLELCSKPINGHPPGQRITDLIQELSKCLIAQGFNESQISIILKEINQTLRI